MASVTQVVSKTTQPKGGYLPMKKFNRIPFYDGMELHEAENIHASLIGMAVDYLSRFAMGASVNEAFHISSLGAALIGMADKASAFKSLITGLDDLSIISACKLAGFDVCLRSSSSAYKPVEDIHPDAETIENIRIMVNRTVSFWEEYGPVVCSELTFEGGYSETVDSGDGDFMSSYTLWDIKVSKSTPTTKHTLQLLIYYIMGLHSIHTEYKQLSNLGFFNPRLNIAYICPISSIPQEIIADIEDNVIRYGRPAVSNQGINISEPSEEKQEFAVVDICDALGLKRNKVYADIRSGRLLAHKKRNKLYVYKEDLVEYYSYLKRQKKLNTVITISLLCAAFVIVALLVYFFYRMQFGFNVSALG